MRRVRSCLLIKKFNTWNIVANKFPTHTLKVWDLEVELKKQFLKKRRSSEFVWGLNQKVLDKHGDGENRKPNYKSGDAGVLPKLGEGWGAEKAGRWGG